MLVLSCTINFYENSIIEEFNLLAGLFSKNLMESNEIKIFFKLEVLYYILRFELDEIGFLLIKLMNIFPFAWINNN